METKSCVLPPVHLRQRVNGLHVALPPRPALLRGRLSLALPASPRPSDGVVGLLLGLTAVPHRLQVEREDERKKKKRPDVAACHFSVLPRARKANPVISLLKQKRGENKREHQSRGGSVKSPRPRLQIPGDPRPHRPHVACQRGSCG